MAQSNFLQRAFHLFSSRERWCFALLSLVCLVGIVGLASVANSRALVEVPSTGGTLSEGLVGSPRFINPLLATSDTDRDLAALIYSGLMRISSDNSLVPDLAASYEVSENGLEYTFDLKPGLVWHDGARLTADDIVFTVEQAKNAVIKSPRLANWEGVSVKKLTDSRILFTLRAPYGGFLEVATLGILPAHLWRSVEPEAFPFSPLNINPVGSGPYELRTTRENSQKIPEAYELAPFKHFALGKAKIANLIIRFYPNEEARLEAYERGELEALAALDPSAAAQLAGSNVRLERSSLPRVFAVFFNTSHAKALASLETRRALDRAVDKSKLVDTVLSGFGTAITDPLGTPEEATSAPTTPSLANAPAFSLTTADTPELKQAAEFLKAAWEKIGAQVALTVFEAGDLNQNVIRPREYDALLFGEVVGRRGELYPFWHSSQRLDPGLNVALYANPAVDKQLEALRAKADSSDRAEDQATVSKAIAADQPAVFLYRPDFLYLVPSNLSGLALPTLNTNAERFANIYEWYLVTDRVWPIFKTLVK